MRTDGTGQLTGKVAVITGATAGIGLAIAKRFVAEGAYVFITGRGQPALDAAAAEIGRNVTGVRGDASVVGDLDRLYAAVAEHGHGIDVLVANAGGGGGSAPVADVSPERFDVSAGLTFRGTYFTVQCALPLLNAALAILLIDRFFNAHVFDPAGGGDASQLLLLPQPHLRALPRGAAAGSGHRDRRRLLQCVVHGRNGIRDPRPFPRLPADGAFLRRGEKA